LVSLDADEDRDPVADYQVIRRELEQFDPELAKRPEIVVLTKLDLTEVQEQAEDLRAQFAELGVELLTMSCASREGVGTVIARLRDRLVSPE
jgi:GTP-binding protein